MRQRRLEKKAGGMKNRSFLCSSVQQVAAPRTLHAADRAGSRTLPRKRTARDEGRPWGGP